MGIQRSVAWACRRVAWVYRGVLLTDLHVTLAGHTKCIMSIAWQPAHVQMPCQRFVTASQDGTAKVWDANTRRCIYTLSGHTRPVTCVKWGGDGYIHSSSRDGTIMVWDAQVGACYLLSSG